MSAKKKQVPPRSKQLLGPEDLSIQEGENATDVEMEEMLRSPAPIRFDTKGKWMKGEQYQHILVNLDNYCKTFDLEKFEQKTHPLTIYTAPEGKLSLTFQTASSTS